MTDRPFKDRPTDADDYFDDASNPEQHPGRDIQPDRVQPESGMGGASDSGAHGPHPESTPGVQRERRRARPGREPGEPAIERRQRTLEYRGPERRVSRR